MENGPSSPYAAFFDINLEPVGKELKHKVVLAVLEDQYGNVLDRGELVLSYRNGAFFVAYYDHSFPLAPETYPHILSHRLDELRQASPADEPDLFELLSIITALARGRSGQGRPCGVRGEDRRVYAEGAARGQG